METDLSGVQSARTERQRRYFAAVLQYFFPSLINPKLNSAFKYTRSAGSPEKIVLPRSNISTTGGNDLPTNTDARFIPYHIPCRDVRKNTPDKPTTNTTT